MDVQQHNVDVQQAQENCPWLPFTLAWQLLHPLLQQAIAPDRRTPPLLLLLLLPCLRPCMKALRMEPTVMATARPAALTLVATTSQASAPPPEAWPAGLGT